MPYPKLKLLISQKTDIDNAINFIVRDTSLPQFKKWFLPNELEFILNRQFSKKERRKILTSFTKHFYHLETKAIKEGDKLAIKNWEKVELKYFKLVDKIFHGHPWPKGNYRGYCSIYHMFPRFIDEKFFFLPYKNNPRINSNGVIAHEMLHFIFFDYLYKKFRLTQNSRIAGKPDKFVWQVSEVFNNVIEGWKPYQKIFKGNPRPYPGTEKIYAKMKKQWAKKQDIDWLLEQWVGEKKV